MGLDVVRCVHAAFGGELEVGEDQFTKPNHYNPFLQEPPVVYEYGRAIEGARGCIRACMIHLEEEGKLKNKFKSRFRRRKPWEIDW